MNTTSAPATEPLNAVLGDGPRPPRPSAASAALIFGWRALLKIKHVPEQLADVIGIPVIFTLVFTYLFGGALAGSTHAYLQFLLPGTLVMAAVLLTVYSGVNLNTDAATGAFDRFRSLPIWRPAPIVGGLLGDTGRYSARLQPRRRARTRDRLPPRRRRHRRPRRDRTRGPVRLLPLLALDDARADPAHTDLRSGDRPRRPLPAHLRQQCLRRPAHDALLGALRRPRQPDQPPDRRRARPHARSHAHNPDRLGPDRIRGAPCRLRTRNRAPLPQELVPGEAQVNTKKRDFWDRWTAIYLSPRMSPVVPASLESGLNRSLGSHGAPPFDVEVLRRRWISKDGDGVLGHSFSSPPSSRGRECASRPRASTP